MRCRLSQYGRKTFPQKADRLGNGRMGKLCAIVRWDGNKTERSYHKDFIEFIQPEQVCEIDVDLQAENDRLRAALQRIADRDVEAELKSDANVLAGMAWAALNSDTGP